jgi:hypothetical protein
MSEPENSPTAYVVVTGHYSDYSIQGVFTDKLLAEKLVKMLNNQANEAHYWAREDARIEKFFLNLSIDEFQVTTVRMAKDGSVLEILHAVGRDTASHNFDALNNLLWSIYGRDEQRAIKVANEKRAQLIANNLWGAQLLEDVGETE